MLSGWLWRHVQVEVRWEGLLNPGCYSSMYKKEDKIRLESGTLLELKKDVWLYAFLCWKRSMNGVAQHSRCRLVGSMERRISRRRRVKGMDGIVEVCDVWNSVGFERD